MLVRVPRPCELDRSRPCRRYYDFRSIVGWQELIQDVVDVTSLPVMSTSPLSPSSSTNDLVEEQSGEKKTGKENDALSAEKTDDKAAEGEEDGKKKKKQTNGGKSAAKKKSTTKVVSKKTTKGEVWDEEEDDSEETMDLAATCTKSDMSLSSSTSDSSSRSWKRSAPRPSQSNQVTPEDNVKVRLIYTFRFANSAEGRFLFFQPPGFCRRMEEGEGGDYRGVPFPKNINGII